MTITVIEPELEAWLGTVVRDRSHCLSWGQSPARHLCSRGRGVQGWGRAAEGKEEGVVEGELPRALRWGVQRSTTRILKGSVADFTAHRLIEMSTLSDSTEITAEPGSFRSLNITVSSIPAAGNESFLLCVLNRSAPILSLFEVHGVCGPGIHLVLRLCTELGK